MRKALLTAALAAAVAAPCACGTAERNSAKAKASAHILTIQRALEQGEIKELERDMARQAEEVRGAGLSEHALSAGVNDHDLMRYQLPVTLHLSMCHSPDQEPAAGSNQTRR